jgi:hypothetical protein
VPGTRNTRKRRKLTDEQLGAIADAVRRETERPEIVAAVKALTEPAARKAAVS